MALIITLFVGFVGATIAKWLKIPAGYLIGSLISVSILSVFSDYAYLPVAFRPVIQILMGTYIGSSIRKANLVGMRKLSYPIFISLSFMVVSMVISTLMLHFIFDFDWATSLLSAVPGGISDITLLSYEFNANIVVVALFQTMRLFMILALFPMYVGRLGKATPRTNTEIPTTIIDSRGDQSVRVVITTLVSGVTTGLLGYFLRFPAGALSFSMVGSATVSSLRGEGYLPIQFRRGVQILSGALIGSGITQESIRNIQTAFPAIVSVLFLFFIINFIVSKIITSKTDLNQATAMFGTAPAGATDMVMIAMEMDIEADRTAIVLLQISRLMVAVTIVPIIIRVVLYLLI